MSALIFLDTETTGLVLRRDDIWEFAAVVRLPNGNEYAVHTFVEHSVRRTAMMPEPFLSDYKARYVEAFALPKHEFADFLMDLFESTTIDGQKPHIVGAVPDFDAYRLERVLYEVGKINGEGFPWHYHLIDIESMAVGYLAAKGIYASTPWNSDEISRALGVDATQFERHTAMGDVRWTMANYDAITKPRSL